MGVYSQRKKTAFVDLGHKIMYHECKKHGGMHVKSSPGYGSVTLQNQKTILNLIHTNRISRMELASRLNLTRPSITQLVDQLTEYGLVQESETVFTGRGRHPMLLDLVPDARYVIGVNIKRSTIDAGIINLVGEELVQASLSSAKLSPQEACLKIQEIVLAQMAELSLPREKVMGIGVCTPGPLDMEQGVLLNPPNFNAWHGFPVVQELERLLGFPALLENVSNALAIEERYFGVAKELDNFIAIQINEGIGAGVFVDGELYHGAHGRGAELGHTSIAYQGRPCPCGSAGCLERYASIPALLEGTPYTSWQQLMDDCPASLPLVRQECDYLGTAIVNALNLFDIDKVVLLGDVTYHPETFLSCLEENLRQRGVNMDGPYRRLLQTGISTSSFRAGAVVYLSRFFTDLSVPLHLQLDSTATP